MAKIIFSIFLTFLISIAQPAEAKRKSSKKKVTPSCRAVIFSDSTRQVRLYGKNVNTSVLPASTTKVMTALLVMEHLPLEKTITVRRNLDHIQPSKIHLRPGERYLVRDLLYAILLNSANDASVVLAEAVSGSEAEFVKLMNRRAKQLGAAHTKFANSNGLPTKKVSQYTTAYDMYMIFRAALKYPFFRQAIAKPYATIKSGEGRKVYLKSHNKMLFSKWRQPVVGKTGYTRAAGACFVGTVKKGNRDLIIGVFNCTDRWSVIKNTVTRYGGIKL